MTTVFLMLFAFAMRLLDFRGVNGMEVTEVEVGMHDLSLLEMKTEGNDINFGVLGANACKPDELRC